MPSFPPSGAEHGRESAEGEGMKPYYDHAGITVYLTEANAKIIHKLSSVGILKFVAHHRVFESVTSVLEAIKE